MLDRLKDEGWTMDSRHTTDELAPNSQVLVVDELFTTVATCLTRDQWNMLQAIVRKECNVLWVTKGGQMSVTEPDRAVAPGLLRTLRSEELGIRFITLDVEEPWSPNCPGHRPVPAAARTIASCGERTASSPREAVSSIPHVS